MGYRASVIFQFSFCFAANTDLNKIVEDDHKLQKIILVQYICNWFDLAR